MRIVFLYWFTLKRKDKRENYGDLLSKYIVKKISKGFVIKVKHPSFRIYKNIIKNYMSIGSIITSANINTVVWGSGIIKKNEFIRNATFLAVRGPLTRKRILEFGYNAPTIYGDPGILLPLFYENKITIKKYKIGIIPHYVDYEDIHQFYKNDNRIKVIDLITLNIEFTTDEILECEFIITSSLHGLIIAHAYRIPAIWIIFSNKLSGDNVKFYDYFESVDIIYNREFTFKVKNPDYDKIINLFKNNDSILMPNEKIFNYRRDMLLKVCPFTK